jgi:hypothetical protein
VSGPFVRSETFYTVVVLEKTQTRALPLLNKGVDLTPVVNACCGVCRTCVTTNIFTLVAAGFVSAGACLARFVQRVGKR